MQGDHHRRLEFLRDQASGNTVLWDLETSQLIKPNVPKSEMTISVACAMVLYTDNVRDPRSALDNSTALTFWHSDADGAPISLLVELLRAARLIVAYNGVAFDLKVMQKYMDEAEMRQLQEKILDPFAILRDESTRWFKLNELLLINGLVPKSNSGAAAPALWREGRLKELEAYCARDVEALASLVLKPRIRLSGATSTDSVSLLTALGLAGVSGEPTPSPSPSDTRMLQQGSRAWHEARQGLITAASSSSKPPCRDGVCATRLCLDPSSSTTTRPTCCSCASRARMPCRFWWTARSVPAWRTRRSSERGACGGGGVGGGAGGVVVDTVAGGNAPYAPSCAPSASRLRVNASVAVTPQRVWGPNPVFFQNERK